MKRVSLLFPAMILLAVIVTGAPIYAGSTDIDVTTRNIAPTVENVSLSPDDDLTVPGIQVINANLPNPRTVEITATVSDLNGHSDITSVSAFITGPDTIGPVILSLDSTVDVAGAIYTGTFDLSTNPEGDYTVEVTAIDKGELSHAMVAHFTYIHDESIYITSNFDFSSGAGIDKFAYHYQHDEKPPFVNNVPGNEFPYGQYHRIAEDDSKTVKDFSHDNGNYAVHRFNFNIGYILGDISKLEVRWTGTGNRLFDEDGVSLYIWNFSTGAYELLDKNDVRNANLNGAITQDTGSYISATGDVIVIAEQNSPQNKLLWIKLRSYISTNYVALSVTHTIPSNQP